MEHALTGDIGKTGISLGGFANRKATRVPALRGLLAHQNREYGDSVVFGSANNESSIIIIIFCGVPGSHSQLTPTVQSTRSHFDPSQTTGPCLQCVNIAAGPHHHLKQPSFNSRQAFTTGNVCVQYRINNHELLINTGS